MLRTLRFVGFLIVHIVIALIGTAILEHAIWRLVPAHSLVGILWKESILSATCAVLIGFGTWKVWPTSAAKWAWLPLAPWFMFGFLVRQGEVLGGLFGFHSGAILVGPESFLVFTVPLLRATSYSIGAGISSLLFSAPVASPQ